MTSTTVRAGELAPAETAPPPSTEPSAFDGRFGAGAQVGFQGIGLHARYDLTGWCYLRLEGNYFEYDDSFDADGIDYDGELDLSNLGLTANFLPFANGFRITAGGYFGNNEFTGIARGAGTSLDIGDTDYVLNPGDSVTGTIEYNSFNPYLGVGWDFVFGSGSNFVFGIDVGVLYLGEPEADLSAAGGITRIPGFADDLRREETLVEDDVSDWEFAPVLKLSFTYRF
jgi:hypothetical protein